MSTREEYFNIVEQEEGEILIQKILAEVLHNCSEVLFEKHIESQVLPYALSFAKDTILMMVEVGLWRVLGYIEC
jgi:hypothetical protein